MLFALDFRQPDEQHGDIAGRDAGYAGCFPNRAGLVSIQLLTGFNTEPIDLHVIDTLGEELVFIF